MRLKVSLLMLGFVCLGSTQMVYAKSSYTVVCPEKISMADSVKSVPTGWQAWRAQSSHLWESIGFYDGHPDGMASLMPEPGKPNKNYQGTWQFRANRERDIYVSCQYQRTAYELIQVLPKNITQCTVTFDRDRQGCYGLIPKAIVCSGE